VPARAGMYESFYLRSVAPDEPRGAWIRHTVHKPPRQPAQGSVWCTVFDATAGAPFMHKVTTTDVRVPPDGWIAIGDGGAGDVGAEGDAPDGGAARARAREGATLGPGRARGSIGDASWELEFTDEDAELRHLPAQWLYRAPLPRTKLTSPAPAARFRGALTLAGRAPIYLEGWRGMIGHNWGKEHAERWIWLHGIGFAEERDAWIDVALGRIKIAGRMTPWVANGAISIGGRRVRLGGLRARTPQVSESARGCSLALDGEGGLHLEATVTVPAGSAAGWRYADPEGGTGHDVVNCSVAALTLSVTLAPGTPARTLTTAHGCAYELGMRERDHGVELAPFDDG
jgi:hypothetical protein